MSEVRDGDVIAGKFRVERVIGEGGMGYVVAARHLQLGQMVALKFMRDEVANDDYRSRFLREARNTVRLKSKHVSRVLDVGELDGGEPYMVLEYLEGTDLSALLQKRGAFPVPEACDYIIQACEAIAEAHGHGIIHRDLKPANLFLTRGSGGEPVVKVLDFGVSKLQELHMDDDGDDTSPGGRRHHDSVVTKATDLLGSPSYMAPEQVVSARDAGTASDVWSLGIILFRLVSGKAPFTGKSLGELIQNIMHGPMPNLRDYRPDLPQGLEYVLWRAMEREKKRRVDVVELARLLAPFAGPNAAPSLERIAILGPALITAPAPPPVMTAPQASTNPSYPGRQRTWTTPPGAAIPTMESRNDMSTTSFLVWAVLFATVVGFLAIVGAKIFKSRQPVPAVVEQPEPPPELPPPLTPPTATTPTTTAAMETATATADPPPVTAPAPAVPLASEAKTAVPPSARPAVRPPVHPRPHPTSRPAEKAPGSGSDIPSSRE